MLRRFTIGLLVLVMALALMPAAAFGQSRSLRPRIPSVPWKSLRRSIQMCLRPCAIWSGVAPAAPDEKEKKEKPLRVLPNMGNALNQADGAVQT